MPPEPSIMDAVLKIRWLIWEAGDLIPLSSKYFSRPAPHIHAKHSGVHLKLLWSGRGRAYLNGGLFCMIHPLEWILLPHDLWRLQKRERLSFNEIEKQSSHPEGRKNSRIYQMLFFCVWNSKSISFSSMVFLNSNTISGGRWAHERHQVFVYMHPFCISSICWLNCCFIVMCYNYEITHSDSIISNLC